MKTKTDIQAWKDSITVKSNQNNIMSVADLVHFSVQFEDQNNSIVDVFL